MFIYFTPNFYPHITLPGFKLILHAISYNVCGFPTSIRPKAQCRALVSWRNLGSTKPGLTGLGRIDVARILHHISYLTFAVTPLFAPLREPLLIYDVPCPAKPWMV